MISAKEVAAPAETVIAGSAQDARLDCDSGQIDGRAVTEMRKFDCIAICRVVTLDRNRNRHRHRSPRSLLESCELDVGRCDAAKRDRIDLADGTRVPGSHRHRHQGHRGSCPHRRHQQGCRRRRRR